VTSPSRKVLFIAADQWRAECLSAVGHPVVKTPHLDALAKDGTLFKQHRTVCAPCGPARTSLHTGLYLMNHRSGRNGTPLDSRHTNIAKEARKAGYDPTLYGYTDTSADPRGRHPNDPALKTYEGPMPGYRVGIIFQDFEAAWMSHLRRQGHDFAGRGDVYKPRDGALPAGRGHRYKPTFFKAEDSDTNFMADLTLDWLKAHRHEDWFLHSVFLRPHPPIIAPEPYNAMYDPAQVPFPARKPTPEAESAQHPFLKTWIDYFREKSPGIYDEHNPNNLVTMPELELRQMRACYYGMINEVDDAVGRIVAHLKATGEYDNTLIVFTCDHGEMGGDHYTWGKELYFDQSFHIPLIIRDPRPQADAGRGRQIDAFSESIDIMPTILSWLGAEVPVECDGASLLPFIEGKAPKSWRTETHMELDFRTTPNLGGFDAETALGLEPDECQLGIIRGKRWKYVHFATLPPLLFDLENDPTEMDNLAQDPKHASVVLDYAQRMLSWRMRFAERTLTNLHLWRDGVIDRRAVAR
jgi:arylsulfatase A-like enzyme